MDSSTSKILSLLEQLDDEIDDLEEVISPLIKAPLSESASKLPLLDKAKLYVLVTYAIESILFSYLRLHGVKAREHPVFTELTRVKQYFEKIKRAETPINEGTGRRENLSLDKGAASRIIKAGLSGNDKYDLERAEQQAKERARAHIKFAEISEKKKQDELSKKRKAEEDVEEEEGPNSSDSNSDADSPVAVVEEVSTPVKDKKKKQKSRKNKSRDASVSTSASEKEKKKQEKQAKRGMKKQQRKEIPGTRKFPSFPG